MNYENDFVLFKDYIRSFVGKCENQLIEETKLETSSKSKLFMLSKLICESFDGPLFFKAICKHENIVLKTIQIKQNGRPKEAMSFPIFKYLDIAKESWHSSTLRNYFKNTYFLFFIFKKNKENLNELVKITLWRMPCSDLEGEMKDIWLKTFNLITNGEIIREIKNGKVITNFPRESDTKFFHVRPHAASGSDLLPLPVTDKLTGYTNMLKHSFWFNHDYIVKIYKDSEQL